MTEENLKRLLNEIEKEIDKAHWDCICAVEKYKKLENPDKQDKFKLMINSERMFYLQGQRDLMKRINDNLYTNYIEEE